MKWLSRGFKKTRQENRARALWEEMETWRLKKDAFPYVELAKYHEHRLRDYETAIAYVDKALKHDFPHPAREMEVLRYRRERLELKKAGSTRVKVTY
jgi:uncharacterized protein YjiS (DUF1127 family)